MRAPACTFTLALSLAACGPAVQFATYTPAPLARVEADAAMRIYEHTRPSCPFEEIGRVTGRARLPTHSADDIVNAMRRRAAEMGGQAIIGFSERGEIDGAVVNQQAAVASVSSSSVYSGTVIRFTDPACSEPTRG